jgi:hypothetical protein
VPKGAPLRDHRNLSFVISYCWPMPDRRSTGRKIAPKWRTCAAPELRHFDVISLLCGDTLNARGDSDRGPWLAEGSPRLRSRPSPARCRSARRDFLLAPQAASSPPPHRPGSPAKLHLRTPFRGGLICAASRRSGGAVRPVSRGPLPKRPCTGRHVQNRCHI